jgi:hypothetical protein
MAECYTPLSYTMVLWHILVGDAYQIIPTLTTKSTSIPTYLGFKRVQGGTKLAWMLSFPSQAFFAQAQPMRLLPNL